VLNGSQLHVKEGDDKSRIFVHSNIKFCPSPFFLGPDNQPGYWEKDSHGGPIDVCSGLEIVLHPSAGLEIIAVIVTFPGAEL
jgi:Zn-finger protein